MFTIDEGETRFILCLNVSNVFPCISLSWLIIFFADPSFLIYLYIYIYIYIYMEREREREREKEREGGRGRGLCSFSKSINIL